MFSPEDRSGKHEPFVCSLVSFTYVSIFVAVSLVAFVSVRHLAEPRFGLEGKIFHERRRLHPPKYATPNYMYNLPIAPYSRFELKRQVFSL